jgi:hypothetical protein
MLDAKHNQDSVMKTLSLSLLIIFIGTIVSREGGQIEKVPGGKVETEHITLVKEWCFRCRAVLL